ncbi:MAG: chemotaxis protein CheD [Alcaligenaceae bacterium]|nr:chemotaxis protein CheD [Alcaligenaceae bacterium]
MTLRGGSAVIAPARSPAAISGRDLERRARSINPGGWAVESDRPISTILGSCVAVCLYDPKLRVGGMNHFLLPSGNRRDINDYDVVLHGDYAMEVLRNALFARGASDTRLVAKAFGGGNVLNAIKMAIGTRNAEFARQWLQREGIPLLAEDMGGTWSRKVVFDPLTGDAFCRRATVQQAEVISNVKAERAYEQSLLNESPRQGGTGKKIELF